MIQEQTNGLPKSATSGFTPQAEAAYPHTPGVDTLNYEADLQRAAFDAGRRSRDAEIAEQREQLPSSDPLHGPRTNDSPHNAWRAGYRLGWNDKGNGREWRKYEANPYPESASSSLVATREAIARAAYGAMFPDAADTYGDPELREERNLAHRIADAVLGVVREVGDVKAEAVVGADDKEAIWQNRPSNAADREQITIPRDLYSMLCDAYAAIRGGEKND